MSFENHACIWRCTHNTMGVTAHYLTSAPQHSCVPARACVLHVHTRLCVRVRALAHALVRVRNSHVDLGIWKSQCSYPNLEIWMLKAELLNWIVASRDRSLTCELGFAVFVL